MLADILQATRMSLVAQWLRFHLPMQEVWVEELRSHMPPGQKKNQNIKQKQYFKKFDKNLKKKVPHSTK